MTKRCLYIKETTKCDLASINVLLVLFPAYYKLIQLTTFDSLECLQLNGKTSRNMRWQMVLLGPHPMVGKMTTFHPVKVFWHFVTLPEFC